MEICKIPFKFNKKILKKNKTETMLAFKTNYKIWDGVCDLWYLIQ